VLDRRGDSMKPLAKDPRQMMADPLVRTLLVRLAMLLVLCASIWLVWRSVNRLSLANRQLKQKSSAVSALAEEGQHLERKWDAEELAGTEARFKDAKESLFAGSEECVAWLKDLPEKTLALGLEPTLEPVQRSSDARTKPKLSLVSMTIELQPTTIVGV